VRLGYQSHYVIVGSQGLPFIMDDYLTNKERYDELVVDQEAQVVPIFILSVSEDKDKITSDFYGTDRRDKFMERFYDLSHESDTDEEPEEHIRILPQELETEDAVVEIRPTVKEILTNSKNQVIRRFSKQLDRSTDQYKSWET